MSTHKKQMSLTPEFVEFIPDQPQHGILYVSLKYGTVLHRCCCGCGEEVITPLSPVDWRLCTDGKTVSLSPSIGNWNYPCKSHYWIRNNKIEWSSSMSKSQIRLIQKRDYQDKKAYMAQLNTSPIPSDAQTFQSGQVENTHIIGITLRRLWYWLKSSGSH